MDKHDCEEHQPAVEPVKAPQPQEPGHSRRKNECGYQVSDAYPGLSRKHQRRHGVHIDGLNDHRPEHKPSDDVRPFDQQIDQEDAQPAGDQKGQSQQKQTGHGCRKMAATTKRPPVAVN